MRHAILLVIMLVWLHGHLLGQEAVVPAGGEAAGSGGTVNWTLGQVAYEASQSAGGNVQRGVQQPYEWLVLSTDETAPPTVSVWPNPTMDQVRLEWTEPLPDDARYALCNSAGSVVHEGSATGTALLIPLERHAAGRYVVRILANGRVQHTLTIQRQ
ncbi:MAG TPA: hypothetical protein PKJ19_10885 [Flavobacteriales bacterium]|nr:hypothetical protein [Flavobacteriales bacterium]HNU56742.1 hypothetical protein [Flavobacteriales bacterium]